MIIPRLADLEFRREIAVIINVNTRDLATEALLSTLRCCETPVVLIDCESADGSAAWFSSLQRDHPFDLVSMKLRPHGETLDLVFQQLKADRILLVDSDVDVRTGEMIREMRRLIDDPAAYGSGFFHAGEWLTEHYGSRKSLAPGIGYYKGRPWIPFSLFKADIVRKAIVDGASFMHKVESAIPWRLFDLGLFRKVRIGSYAFYDTGARLHERLSSDGFQFRSVDAGVVPWSVKHHHGKTREGLRK